MTLLGRGYDDPTVISFPTRHVAVTSHLKTTAFTLVCEKVFLLLGETFVLKCFIFCTFVCNISCK